MREAHVLRRVGTATRGAEHHAPIARFLLALALFLALGVSSATAATTVDGGFESGADAAALASPTWTLSGAPQRHEYDSAKAKGGTMSAWIQGAATGVNAGVWESSSGGLSANGAEHTFWVYADTTSDSRLIEDYAGGLASANRAFLIQLAPGGLVKVLTDRSVNPVYAPSTYTTVGGYATGWTQYRIVYDFAAQTYTLSQRTGATDSWTQLKSAGATSYAIPFRGTNTITATHGTLWRALGAGQMWVDDLTYSDTPAPADTTPPTVPTTLLASDHPADQGGAIDLSWGAATDDVGVIGYHVRRGTVPGVYMTTATVQNVTNYSDTSAATGITYYYAVSALDAAGNESPLSPEVSATALDNMAPAAPKGLATSSLYQSVALTWSSNSEADIAGYDVYRDGVKITSTPVTATSFTDTGRSMGVTYSYRVSAIDSHGNVSPQCAAVGGTPTAVIPPPAASSTVDSGFENTTGDLSYKYWTVCGTPQKHQYDGTRAKGGSQSGLIQGSATGGNAGVYETVSGGISANGAEVDFWVYLDTTNQSRLIEDYADGLPTGQRASLVQFAPDGTIDVLTDRPGSPNGYATGALVPVGTYTTGWTQYRIVYTFTGANAQTYTLSKRASSSDAWTPLKAAAATGYAIPMRGATTIPQTHGLLARGLGSAQMWLDDITFSSGAPVPGIIPTRFFGESTTVSAGSNHSVALWSDGTVRATGYNAYGQCNVSGWSGITAVSAGAGHTVGLKADGTVVATGLNDHGQCNVSDWTNIAAVSAGGQHTVGLKPDGTVTATGNNVFGECNVSQWTDITAVSAGNLHTVGLKADGTVVATGFNNYGQCNVSSWTGIVAVSAGSLYTVGLRADGTLVATGNNSNGKCDVSSWTNVVAVDAGGSLTVALRADGTALDTANGVMGDPDVSGWSGVSQVSAGMYHALGFVPSDGTVYGTGYDGHGETDVSSWDVDGMGGPQDVAPATPVGLTAVGGTGSITLTWQANTEPDLAGYDVYRNFSKINSSLVTGTTFTDSYVSDGVTYAYRLVAVDVAGKGSPQTADATATTNVVIPPLPAPTVVDGGFESGSDAATLASPPWTASGVPQRREYDTARAKLGTMSAWIQGSANGANAGVWESASGGMSSNGAEIRFWLYLDSTNQSRLLDDYALGVAGADRAIGVQFGTNGDVNVLTDRPGSPNGYTTSAYTKVGTYTTGWTEYRIVYTFTGTGAQTYTLSSRNNSAYSWKQMKAADAADYNIPFKGANTITATHGTLWRGLGNAQLWLDDLRFADGGMAY